MKDLPEGDVYLVENYMKMPNNVNVAGAHLFYVKLQILAMLIALINNKNQIENPSIENSKFSSLFDSTMKYKLKY